jgi:hypothetical protein
MLLTRIQADRILVHLADGITHIEQGQEAGRVPSGARGELLALDQHAVGPAELSQVIQRRHADDAAADHHRAGM